jgi:hypothetical protein
MIVKISEHIQNCRYCYSDFKNSEILILDQSLVVNSDWLENPRVAGSIPALGTTSPL